jgi:uncharacterized membrane protein
MDMNRVETRIGERDRAESMLRDVDAMATQKTGTSFFHILTILSIIGSLVLFFSGKRTAAIFVGLWPPTFQALKSAAENR